MRLAARCGDVGAVHPDVGTVVGAHPGELCHRRQHRVAAAHQMTAKGQIVAGSVVCGVGRVEDLQPILGAVALTRDQDHGRRTCSAAFDENSTPTADFDPTGTHRRAQRLRWGQRTGPPSTTRRFHRQPPVVSSVARSLTTGGPNRTTISLPGSTGQRQARRVLPMRSLPILH